MKARSSFLLAAFRPNLPRGLIPLPVYQEALISGSEQHRCKNKREKKRQMTSWRKSIWISQVPKQKTMTLENNCLNLKMWHMSQFKKAGKEHAKTMPDCYMSGWISFRKSHTEDCTKHILSNVLDLWLFLERSFAKQNLYVFCSLLA